MSAELLKALQECSRQASQRAVDEMYGHPFWTARFGARGRQHAEADGMYHLSYLQQALHAQDSELLVAYARWLRSVLVVRGMCTQHLVENFARLARVLRELALPDVQRAVEMLEAAQSGLLYPSGPARRLQDRSAALARSGAEAHAKAWPDFSQRALEKGLGSVETQLLELTSFCADGVAMGRSELFVGHVLWCRDFYASLELSPPGIESLVDVLWANLRDSEDGAEARGALVQAHGALR